MAADQVLVLKMPRAVWISGLVFSAACVILAVVVWHPAPLAVGLFGLIVASFPLLAHLDAVKLDGPRLSVRKAVRWVGPIDLRTLEVFAYRAGTLRSPAVWLLIQRDAGSRFRWHWRRAVAPETRSRLRGQRDLRVVQVAAGGGLSELPGLADHLERYVSPSDAYIEPSARTALAQRLS